MITKARRLELPVDVIIDIFDLTVLPVLLYGCEVWGCSNFSDIEVFYRSFLKIILKLGKSTPNCMVYGETGCTPLLGEVICRMVGFWGRLVQGQRSKLSFMLYYFTSNLLCIIAFNFGPK